MFHHRFKMYTPNEPHKWGLIKPFIRCSSEGYCYNFEIHSGKESRLVNNENNFGASTTVRAFRNEMNLQPCDAVISHRSLKLWVANFRETESAYKKVSRSPMIRSNGAEHWLCSTGFKAESDAGSGRKHATALNMSTRSFRRIVGDVGFHPYKISF